MKVTFYNNQVSETEDCESLCDRVLEGSDYGLGEVEAARQQNENNSKCIGRLMDVLLRDKVIDVNDVEQILNSYKIKSIEA